MLSVIRRTAVALTAKLAEREERVTDRSRENRAEAKASKRVISEAYSHIQVELLLFSTSFD